VPLPWHDEAKGAFGFSANEALKPVEAWLPQSEWWGKFAATLQDGKADSTLTMYRKALAIRKAESGLGDGPMQWLDVNDQVLAFTRPGNFACYVNFGAEIELPVGAEVLLSSGPLNDHKLPTDTAVWLRLK
jgi:alpha-glucosidase